MTSPADKLDLDRLRRGDAEEFARLVRLHEHWVLGLCQSLGLSPADREDAAAETFAMAYRALVNFRGDAELSTWLYRIAWRTALKVRKRYPAPPSVPPASAAGETADPRVASPEFESEAREMNESVWRAVARLEPEQGAAVEMFYRRGMSIEEIAGILEKPAGTIKTLLFRAREKLRHLLRPLEQAT